MTEKDAKFAGSCLCGAVTYEITAEPFRVAQCCCTDCQKITGTGHATIAFFPEDACTISGKTAEFAVIADSGNTNTRVFCPECGSRLFGRNTARPGVIGVMAGSLDRGADGLQPQAIVYVKRQHGWDMLDEALPRFEMMPPPPPQK